jgi:hypothetical protein
MGQLLWPVPARFSIAYMLKTLAAARHAIKVQP